MYSMSSSTATATVQIPSIGSGRRLLNNNSANWASTESNHNTNSNNNTTDDVLSTNTFSSTSTPNNTPKVYTAQTQSEDDGDGNSVGAENDCSKDGVKKLKSLNVIAGTDAKSLLEFEQIEREAQASAASDAETALVNGGSEHANNNGDSHDFAKTLADQQALIRNYGGIGLATATTNTDEMNKEMAANGGSGDEENVNVGDGLSKHNASDDDNGVNGRGGGDSGDGATPPVVDDGAKDMGGSQDEGEHYHAVDGRFGSGEDGGAGTEEDVQQREFVDDDDEEEGAARYGESDPDGEDGDATGIQYKFVMTGGAGNGSVNNLNASPMDDGGSGGRGGVQQQDTVDGSDDNGGGDQQQTPMMQKMPAIKSSMYELIEDKIKPYEQIKSIGHKDSSRDTDMGSPSSSDGDDSESQMGEGKAARTGKAKNNANSLSSASTKQVSDPSMLNKNKDGSVANGNLGENNRRTSRTKVCSVL